MKFEFPNTPREVLPILKRELERFGAQVKFLTEHSGQVHSIAGELAFAHSQGILTIQVVKEHGHFSRSLLIGGIKQMVSESCEIARIEKEAIA